MNWVSGADLVAAVSNAGGLGVLGPNAGSKDITRDVELTAERIRGQIRRTKELTKSPFGVNIIATFVENLAYSKKVVEVVIEEQVPVAVVSVGKPETYTTLLKDAGIKVMHVISTPDHARKAEAVGVDAVVCVGYESGGHKGFAGLTTFVLTPMVADAVNIPVVAGGGVADARGMLAAIALGADGVYMGTRFMVTRESASHASVKKAIVKGKGACTVSLPKDFMIARDLANSFTREYIEMRKSGADQRELNMYLSEHSQYRAQFLGHAEEAEICCGQVAGLISEEQGANEVLRGLVDNISSCFEELKRKLDGA